MTDSKKVEKKLRNVAYCNMHPEHAGGSYVADFGLALTAARLIKRQRAEIESLMGELAYHGIYPRPISKDIKP